MKTTLLYITVLVLLATLQLQSQWVRNFNMKYSSLDIGNFTLRVDHLGGLRSEAGGGDWKSPKGNLPWILFTHGLNVIGKVHDTVKANINYWWNSFSPGPLINGVSAIYSPLGDTSRYHVYKITRGDDPQTNSDLRHWPSDLGAPIDSHGKAKLYGDQSLWMVYNGADYHARPYGGSTWRDSLKLNLPIEIRESMYSYSTPPLNAPKFLTDVVFMEWELINKGNAAIDSCFIGFWTDIDFNDANTPPGVDTTLQLGYCWTPRETVQVFVQSGGVVIDTQYYYYNPITVGYTLLYGPHVSAPGSSAIFKERTLQDSRNLPMTSFWGIEDDSYGDSSYLGPPYSVGTIWNVVRGFDQRGRILVDSTTGNPTHFMYSGDPVTNSGWIFPRNHTSGGAGFLFYSGPVSIAPNDTQWVMIALIPTLGENKYKSIEQLRYKTAIVRELDLSDIHGKAYDWIEHPTDNLTPPAFHFLYQNYPNPFNPVTTVNYDIGVESNVEITIHNILGQEITTLVNERKPIGRYSVNFNAGNLASGVYLCRMKLNYLIFERKMMVIR